MRIKINKGTHYPYRIPLALPLYIPKNRVKSREANFLFTESCMYDLHNQDQNDVNKLFGFSIGEHHWNSSFRFGWRPDLVKQEIQIVAYEYRNGARQPTKPIGNVSLERWYTYHIAYDPINNISSYCVVDENYNWLCTTITQYEKAKYIPLGYTLGVYFGGNEKAPHDMIILKSHISLEQLYYGTKWKL